ncbi:uncharacterized protein [Globicephala melas]|uniref:uncharacterized protein isoform X5 n=1 Tax=Globicephala melas TaxID=9731 RepID=UPI0038735B15
MRWNFEEQHGNEILLLYLVGGENVPACMPTGTTFSRTVKPSVNYAVPPSSRILVPGPNNEELGVPVANPADRKGGTEMREKIKGTLGAIRCCCRAKSRPAPALRISTGPTEQQSSTESEADDANV